MCIQSMDGGHEASVNFFNISPYNAIKNFLRPCFVRDVSWYNLVMQTLSAITSFTGTIKSLYETKATKGFSCRIPHKYLWLQQAEKDFSCHIKTFLPSPDAMKFWWNFFQKIFFHFSHVFSFQSASESFPALNVFKAARGGGCFNSISGAFVRRRLQLHYSLSVGKHNKRTSEKSLSQQTKRGE